VVSHDLKAPMRQIGQFVRELALQVGDLDEDASKTVDVLHQLTDRLQDMVSNLLNYSRMGLQDDRMEVRSIAELIAEAIDALSVPMRESQAKVKMQLLPNLLVDPLLMARLFQNLLGNSIKYRGADIQPEIHVSAERDGDAWVIAWEDKGIGIDPLDSERIFKIFTRLHGDESVFAGSGVGLALCKRVVESHGGDIWLDTDYLEGARFCIRLPVVEPGEPAVFSA